ncbi:MAG: hypothetical protein Q8P46_16355 [Hyphomicrobiales bacterium]|nr:hypothetical protein [Hyphomicrobiales bacterium]
MNVHAPQVHYARPPNDLVEDHNKHVLPVMPLGRCDRCRAVTYEIDAINEACDFCGEAGIMASMATPNWRPCPPCFSSGRSLLCSNDPDAWCPVCHGSGFITDADAGLARDEWDGLKEALAVRKNPTWPPSHRDVRTTMVGSFTMLRGTWTEAQVAALDSAVSSLDYELRHFPDRLPARPGAATCLREGGRGNELGSLHRTRPQNQADQRQEGRLASG